MKKTIAITIDIEVFARIKEHSTNISATLQELAEKWLDDALPVDIGPAQKAQIAELKAANAQQALDRIRAQQAKDQKESDEPADDFPTREPRPSERVAELMKTRPKKKLFTDEELEQIRRNREERDRIEESSSK